MALFAFLTAAPLPMLRLRIEDIDDMALCLAGAISCAFDVADIAVAGVLIGTVAVGAAGRGSGEVSISVRAFEHTGHISWP